MKTQMIGEKGRLDLEHGLHACGVKSGFERGFASLVLGHTAADLAQLTEAQAEQIRADARRMAEFESQARSVDASNKYQHLSLEEVIHEGSAWLGL